MSVLRWFGHISRMTEDRMVSTVLRSKVEVEGKKRKRKAKEDRWGECGRFWGKRFEFR